MDENKRKKLHVIGYKIADNCGLCKHGEFPNDEWGTCAINTYEHLKHTGEPRQLSIHLWGHCPQFEQNDVANAGLAAFVEYRESVNLEGIRPNGDVTDVRGKVVGKRG